MKKSFWKSALAVICVLALAAGILSTAAFASENDTIYINGEKKVFTADGELSAILRLRVEAPGRIHILTSGANVALAIYNEDTFELCGTYATENGMMDVPFDVYPGTYLLGFSGWGEVAVLVVDESTAAQLNASSEAAPAEEPAEEPSEETSEETAEEPAEESPEEGTEEPVEEVAAESTDEAADASAEESSEESVEKPADESAEDPAEKSIEETPADPAAADLSPEPLPLNPEESVETAPEAPEEVSEEPAEPVEDSPAAADLSPDPLPLTPVDPVHYEFKNNAPVSVLSILNEAGSPVNMIRKVTKETDGFFSSLGSTDGDWIFTPFAYFDSIEVSVKAGYFNPSDSTITDADYTLVLSYPDPAQAPAEAPAEELPAAADEPAEEPAEEIVEAPAEEPAEAPAEKVIEEKVEDSKEDSLLPTPDSLTPEETPEPLPLNPEEPEEALPEEPTEESLLITNSSLLIESPIHYEFPGAGTYSVLSILNEAGSPVNMVQAFTRDTDGWFFATAGSDGDWLLTPYAYFDSIEVSVQAAYFNPADSSITSADYTLVLSYPDPEKAPADAAAAALTPDEVEEPAEESAEEAEEPSEESLLTADSSLLIDSVTIAMERMEGKKIRLYADNLEPEETAGLAFQWQSSQDNEFWVDIPGANSTEYIFPLDSTTSTFYWRLIVSGK